MKITAYQFVSKTKIEDLNRAATVMISQGWEPFGSPVVIVMDRDFTTANLGQAFVQYAIEPVEKK